MDSLATTNIWLGIIAVVSLLQGLLLVGVGIGAWRAYRAVMEVVAGLEHRHVAPAVARLTAILDDVQAVSATVKAETDRVDQAIHRTMNRVDDTAHRVQSSVRAQASRVAGFAAGVRTAIAHFARARHQRVR